MSHCLVQKLVPFLNWVFERHSDRVLTFILEKRLRLLHILTLNSIHFATAILNYLGHTLRPVVLGALFVHNCLLEIIFQVSHANGAISPHNSLYQLLIFKIDPFSLNFLSEIMKRLIPVCSLEIRV